MANSFLVGVTALSMLMSSAALARSDCHQDMKDMLQGTLDMAKQTGDRRADDDESNGCTLADRKGERSPLAAISPLQSHLTIFTPSV
jgi:hypothetical protein